MKLTAFTVTRFRSIKEAYKLKLGNYAVLVGPNNEGKSNLLKALVLAIEMLSTNKRSSSSRMQRYNDERISYNWDRDYPLSLQSKKGESNFVLEFELTSLEKTALKAKIRMQFESTLKISISIGQGNKPVVEILLRGPEKKAANSKSDVIAEFINERVKIEYIPAARTSEFVMPIIESLVSDELATLEKDPEYINAINKIEELQRPKLMRLGKEITATLKGFIPEIKKVDLVSGRRLRNISRGGAKISIDDGTVTQLDLKGDGIKSLTAISLVKHISQKALKSQNLILVIEEPEVHLHPKAIHRLSEVISELSELHQVIVTTHNPVLVQRSHVERNILVQNGTAETAESIGDIRESLGVFVSDNLICAETVLFVEGEDDKILVEAIFRDNGGICSALDAGRLIIQPMLGASKLKHNLQFYRGLLCNTIVLMDHDQAGRDGVAAAKKESLLTDRFVFFTMAKGMANSEMEDLLDQQLVKKFLADSYVVAIDDAFYNKPKAVWSDRLERYFLNAGKPYGDDAEAEIKYKLAMYAKDFKLNAFAAHNRPLIEGLIKFIEKLLLVN